VNVFRHYHITDQQEAILRADLVENFDEAVSGARRAEGGSAAITTEGDEVEIAASVKTSKSVEHERKVRIECKVRVECKVKDRTYMCYLQRVVRE
jgi:hypothetical protein